MNIVVLHRIPFKKIRYDLAVDHREHTVRYLSMGDVSEELPAGSERRFVDVASGETEALAKRHADWLSHADRVIALSEYHLLPAALLREEFGIAGDLPADVLPVRDKWVMRNLAGKAGIPQPSFWSTERFRHSAPRDGLYLIKPRLEASSTGIELGDANYVLDRIESTVGTADVFVEEFVPGEIWHLDGYLSGGELEAVVSSVYVGDCLSYAFGSPLGSGQTPDAPAALSLMRATMLALGQRNGCFHFETIRAPDGRFLFLETAARVGGAGVAETFELRTGINLYQVDLQYQLWRTIEKPPERASRDFYGWFVFPAHHRSELVTIDFDPHRFEGRLHSFVQNARPLSHVGQISYTARATPLSGVVQGTAREVRQTLQEICSQTEILVHDQ